MARVNLNCTCGWTFFIPGTTTGHEVNCPNCGQSVRIPGRKPGQNVAMTAGEVAAEHQRRQSMVRMGIGLVAVLLVAGIVYALIPSSAPPPAEEVRIKEPPPLPPPRVTPKPPPVAPRPPEAPPPLYSEAQIEEFTRIVHDRIRLINMTTIVAEIVRYRSLQPGAYEKLQAEIAGHEAVIRSTQAKLEQVDKAVRLDNCCARGDRIVIFDGSDFRLIFPGTAAQVLHNWALSWNPNAAIAYQTVVMRESRQVTLALAFTEESKELRAVLDHPALKTELLSAGGATDRAAVPADLTHRYQTAMKQLPAEGLQLLPPAEKKRLTELLQVKIATADDAEWLKTRVLDEMLPALEADQKTIRLKITDLEPQLKENPAPDLIHLKDGTKIHGKAVPEGEERVRIKFRGGSRPVSKAEIDKIEEGKGYGTEAAKRIETSKGDLAKLVSTLEWCMGKPLVAEKQFVACQILLLDPANDKARSTAGLARPTIPGPK